MQARFTVEKAPAWGIHSAPGVDPFLTVAFTDDHRSVLTLRFNEPATAAETARELILGLNALLVELSLPRPTEEPLP